MKVLILKDNYNSFEQYYLKKLNECGVEAKFYYTSSSILRKFFTHYSLPFESIWYGNWKNSLNLYDCIIVFDSLHSTKLLEYINNRYKKRLIFWHWNPIKKDKDKAIWNQSKKICEHWTFNPKDAKNFGMQLNNQFFFYQNQNDVIKEDVAFFVGTNKGRYEKLIKISDQLKKVGVSSDFHIISSNKKDNREFFEKNYMEYDEVIEHIKNSKAVVEIVQDGQNGLTARSLEAMFFETKLITNNKEIKSFSFYNKNNIFIIGIDDNKSLQTFLHTPFQTIDKKELYPYEANGWINNFF